MVRVEEVVEVRGTTTPVPQHEEGWLDGRILDPRAKTAALNSPPGAILDALGSDRERAGQAGGGDGEALIPEQLDPVAQRDACQNSRAQVGQEGFTPTHRSSPYSSSGCRDRRRARRPTSLCRGRHCPWRGGGSPH